MKKSYKFGEMLLYLREEYQEYEYLLKELNKCISVTNNKDFYFKGNLTEEENKIILIIEKNYSEILKKIQRIIYDWYSHFLYMAYFDVVQNENETYTLKEDFIPTPLSDTKIFTPSIAIVDQDKFDSLINELLSLDIMQIPKGNFYINHDLIRLNFGSVFISSKLGYESLIHWNGKDDTLDYSIKKDCSPSLIERILCLEIPADYITPEWLSIFEKHEKKFNNDIFFDADINIPKKKGYLQIDTTDSKVIKLLRKS